MLGGVKARPGRRPAAPRARRAGAARAVLGLALLAGALGGCSPAQEPAQAAEGRPTAPAPPPPAPPPAAALPAVADLHVDTPTQAMERGISLARAEGLEASLAASREGGVTVVVHAMWIPRRRHVPDPRARLRALLDVLEKGVAEAPGWAFARSPGEARRLLAAGTRVVVPAIESASAFTRGPEDLHEAFRRGVRMVGPTWTASNEYADSSAEPRSPGGLTEKGRALVRLANDLGVMVDVSHMSDAALEDALAVSRAPLVASHSNARALCDHPRNLTDDQARRIAAAGGLVAVMFHAPFVCGDPPVDADDVAAHVAHLVAVAGPGHVAIGSDLDGRIRAARGLGSHRSWPALRQALLRRGISGPVLDGILGENFLRYWERVEASARRGGATRP